MQRYLWLGLAFIAVVGFFAWTKSAPSIESPANVETNGGESRAAPGPDEKIIETSETAGTFVGYYEPLDRVDGFTDKAETCNTLVVLDGHRALVEYFMRLVREGNTVSTVNPSGNLRLNLPWIEISEVDRAKILASSPNRPIEIELKKKVEEGRGVGPCYSFFSFVKII